MPPHLIRAAADRFPYFPSRRMRDVLRVAALAGTLLLGGCLYGQQRDLTELAQGEIWLALPMGSWLGTQNMGEPEAIAACLATTCTNRLAVGVFRLENNKATQTEAELRDPQLLVRMLNARQDADSDLSRTKFDLDATAFSTGGLDGFSVVIAKREDGEAVLHAAAVGRRDGKDMRVVFAVGDEAGVVRAAVAQLVQEGF